MIFELLIGSTIMDTKILLALVVLSTLAVCHVSATIAGGFITWEHVSGNKVNILEHNHTSRFSVMFQNKIKLKLLVYFGTYVISNQ